MKTTIGLLAGAFCLMLSLPAAAQISHSSVRAAAMGEVLLASDQEPAAVFTSPAGLAALSAPAISTFYQKPFAGLPGISLWAGDLAVAVPFDFGVFAVGYSIFQGDTLLREQAASLVYSNRFMDSLDAGVAVKYLFHDYLIGQDPLAAADPVFQNGTAKGVPAVDLGVAWNLDSSLGLGRGRSLRIGLAARNLNQPDWGLVSTDRVMLQAQFGLAWQPGDWGLTVIGDLGWNNTASGEMDQPLVPALGLEKTLAGDAFALRLGVTPLEATGGFGISWQGWTLDYAVNFKFNLLTDNLGSHQIGLTYAFGTAGRGESMPAPAALSRPPAAELGYPAPGGLSQPPANVYPADSPAWQDAAPAPAVKPAVKAAVKKPAKKPAKKKPAKKKKTKTTYTP